MDLTEKIGAPYDEIPLDEKEKRFQAKVVRFFRHLPPEEVPEFQAILDTFDVEARTYTKTNSALESSFMRFLLPEAKFVPHDQQSVVYP
jgi:hypothetical protein